MKSFCTFNKSGYVMTIKGYRVNVQWGPGTYSDNFLKGFNDCVKESPNYLDRIESDTAEVMIRKNDLEIHLSYCNVDTVSRIIGCIVSMPDDENIEPSVEQIYEAQKK